MPFKQRDKFFHEPFPRAELELDAPGVRQNGNAARFADQMNRLFGRGRNPNFFALVACEIQRVNFFRTLSAHFFERPRRIHRMQRRLRKGNRLLHVASGDPRMKNRIQYGKHIRNALPHFRLMALNVPIVCAVFAATVAEHVHSSPFPSGNLPTAHKKEPRRRSRRALFLFAREGIVIGDRNRFKPRPGGAHANLFRRI